MVVYVVGQARVNEADGFKKYSETVAGLAEKFGGKLIAAGSSGEKVVIDSVSLPYLKDSTIDFSDEIIGAKFTIENPNAKSSCGCGTSFSF